MRKEYDFVKLKGRKNPYRGRLRNQRNSIQTIKLTKEEKAIEESRDEYVPVQGRELAQMKSDLKAFAERRKELSTPHKQLLKKLKKKHQI